MRTITIANQPWLSFPRIARITLDGIRYRLFRASVTIAVIMLAVAFMMNILAESLVKRRIATDCRQKSAKSQCVYKWIFRLGNPGNRDTLLRELAAASPDSELFIECKAMSKLNDEDMTVFHKNTIRIIAILDFFDSLDYAKCRVLTNGKNGLEVLQSLQQKTALDDFNGKIAQMKSLRFPIKDDEFRQLLDSLDTPLAITETILQGRRQAIQRLSKHLAGQSLIEALAQAETNFGDHIREAGFCFSAEETAPLVAEQSRQMLDILHVKKLLDVRLHIYSKTTSDTSIEQPFRQLLAQRTNTLPADVTLPQLWKELQDRTFASQFINTLNMTHSRVASDDSITLEGALPGELSPDRLSPERLRDLSILQNENARLVQAERLTADCSQGFLGLGERLCWLLIISMFVCGIGIANAMMMSVTERFNEIATMKCLGALDGFIMLMFVLESCIMGITGGIGGALIGSFIALGRLIFTFGPSFLLSLPVGDLLFGILCSILMGTLLAAVSAIIPSYKAAILAPMEAMRVE